MPSKTLLFSSILGIITFFQGTIALPPSSTTSLIPESATTFGELVQATPTTAVELSTTSNSTLASLESDSNDSESHIVKRKGDPAWIEFHNNQRCEKPLIGKRLEQARDKNGDKCCNLDEESAAASYIWIHWGTDDFRMSGLRWFAGGYCNYWSGQSWTDNNHGHGICVKRPDGIQKYSVSPIYH